jgi:hypothetical protein
MLDPGDSVTALRLRLRAAGYHPLPAEGKAPPMQGWQEKFDTTLEEIQLWQRLWHMARNTGVLAKFAPALDIDLMDEAACESIEELVSALFSHDASVLSRIGQPPKRLVPFQTASPFRKLILNVVAPNGARGKVELLADGQQYICGGIHPTTLAPYRWHGASCLADVSYDELPLIRDAQHAQELLDKIGAMLVAEHGYRLDQPKAKDGNGQSGEQADVARLVDNILNGRDLHNSLCAYAMSLVGSGASQRQATATLRAPMDAAQIPHDERWKQRRSKFRDSSRAPPPSGKPRPPPLRPPATSRSRTSSPTCPHTVISSSRPARCGQQAPSMRGCPWCSWPVRCRYCRPRGSTPTHPSSK